VSKYSKFIKTEKVKKASFLDDFLVEENCTKTAHLKLAKKENV